MKYSNIELFNLITGDLFAQLYESFPEPTKIDFDTLGIKFIEPSDYHGALSVSQFSEATVRWLADAEYIWLDPPATLDGKHTARLSPKGLEILRAIPDSLEEKIPLGEKIVEFSKKTIATSLSDTVKLALGLGVKYLINVT
jgi:hypothetical protein